MNPEDIPSEDDEQWVGNDEKNEVITAVMGDLLKLHFASMKSGPYDGGCSLIMTVGIKRYGADGVPYLSPVSIIFNPEDTVNLVSTCFDIVEESDADWDDDVG